MNDEARNIGDIIREMAEQNPAIVVDLGGADTFNKTMKKINAFDTKFEETGKVFFSLGSTPMETAAKFTEIHIEQYRDAARPSLPALVKHHLDEIGLDSSSPHYKAAILVAARAEIDLAKTPEYHNTNHYADVTAHVAELLKRNNALANSNMPGAIKLSKEDMADSITAAVGHDLEHPGGKNNLPGQKAGEFDRYRLEEQSFQAMLPLMKEAGLPQKSIDDIHVMILTTSPDGPHSILKAVAKAHHEGNGVDWAKIDPDNKYPELKTLATDPKLSERAAILEDSDLGASAFEGLKSNIKMSQVFTEELQSRDYRSMAGPNAGKLENLNGPHAREGFSKFVVGDGPASLAGQDAVGQNYTEMRASTQKEIAAMTPPPAVTTTPPAASMFTAPKDDPKTVEPPVSLVRNTPKANKFGMG